MTPVAAPAVSIDLDPVNPGQFFACCGFLEVADRLWKGAEGWFSSLTTFCVRPNRKGSDGDPSSLMFALSGCRVTSAEAEDEQASEVDKTDKNGPLLLGGSFGLRLDWWLDKRAGGSRFKTWAGQQSVTKIADAMKRPIESTDWGLLSPTEWLRVQVNGAGLPFNFDSDLGPQAAAIDVGFSLDPLKIGTPVRPVIEFAALIGLQRFRPFTVPRQNRHRYALWQTPLLPAAAAVAAAAIETDASWPTFEFPLLYRTEYLKSFLPAQPWRNVG